MKKPADVPRKRGRNIGKFASVKTAAPLNVYSSLTKDLMFLLDADPTVSRYTTEAPTVGYFPDSLYIPFRTDLVVEYGMFSELLLIRRHRHSEKMLAALRQACAKREFEIRIIDESFIRCQPRLNNSKILHRYARQNITVNHNVALFHFFQNRSVSTIGDFQTFLRSREMEETIVLTFLFRKYLRYDANTPITDDSEITLVQASEMEVNFQ